MTSLFSTHPILSCIFKSKTNPSFWGGKGYVTQSTYSDVASLGRGFMDATSLYCPSLVPVRSAYSAHNSECGSVTTMDAAEEEVRHGYTLLLQTVLLSPVSLYNCYIVKT